MSPESTDPREDVTRRTTGTTGSTSVKINCEEALGDIEAVHGEVRFTASDVQTVNINAYSPSDDCDDCGSDTLASPEPCRANEDGHVNTRPSLEWVKDINVDLSSDEVSVRVETDGGIFVMSLAQAEKDSKPTLTLSAFDDDGQPIPSYRDNGGVESKVSRSWKIS